MIANWVSFKKNIGVSASKIAKTASFWLDAHFFAYFEVLPDFNSVNIKI